MNKPTLAELEKLGATLRDRERYNAGARPPFVLISAARPNMLPEALLGAHHALGDELRERGYHPIACDGCYNGAREMSFCVPMSASVAWIVEIQDLQDVARLFEQESILYVAFSGAATLLFDANPFHDRKVGVWREVESPAHNSQIGASYTELGGRYYVAS